MLSIQSKAKISSKIGINNPFTGNFGPIENFDGALAILFRTLDKCY
jgi:hypothetical protein